MNYKKKINKFILWSVICFVVGIITSAPNYIGLCEIRNYSCMSSFIDIGQPIWVSSFVLLITFLLLRWLPESVYIAWKKFAKGFLPLAVLLILITGTSGGGMAPDREGVLYFLSAVYGFITVFIILITLVILCINKLKNKR